MASRAEKLAYAASLLAAALILSYIEAIVPFGGFRIGLTNIATVLACFMLSRRQGAIILLCRVMITSILFGSATTFAFSLCGGILAWCVTALLMPLSPRITMLGISMLAAAAHNIGQVIAACFVLGSPAPLAMLWWLLLIAIPSGIVTGFLSQIIYDRIKTKL